MKIPPRLIPLVSDGIIDEVLAQVKSGKEADVFVVRVGEHIRCAKVYKEANNRSFRQAVQYQEGRRVQNSRSARAMSKRTNYGRKESEASWINAEVEALNTLSAAGIRVPKPFGFFDGVLIMELILGEDGLPAPRLDDVVLTADTALLYHEELVSQVVRMLCSGLIHGDLSEFNVLVDAEGPVIIDLPQAVNAAGNNSAGMMLARDVNNLARYFGRFEPGILSLNYAGEIWDLYQKGKLTPHVELTGKFVPPKREADVYGMLDVIGDVNREREDKLEKLAARAASRAAPPEDTPPQRWGEKNTSGSHRDRPSQPGSHRDKSPQSSGHPRDKSSQPGQPVKSGHPGQPGPSRPPHARSASGQGPVKPRPESYGQPQRGSSQGDSTRQVGSNPPRSANPPHSPNPARPSHPPRPPSGSPGNPPAPPPGKPPAHPPGKPSAPPAPPLGNSWGRRPRR